VSVAVNWGDPRLPERFWKKTSPCPVTACWHWTGHTDRRTGKPLFRKIPVPSCQSLSALRTAYDALVGPVRDLAVVGNRCDVGCCNPGHALIIPRLREGSPEKLARRRDLHAARRRRNPDRAYFKSIRYNYGLSRDRFVAMMESQGAKCAIPSCPVSFEDWETQILSSDSPKSTNVKFVVDHCHRTGLVRGILCHACNVAVGLFDDCPQQMRDAADYAERHAAKAAS
jgi:hypothetical protein